MTSLRGGAVDVENRLYWAQVDCRELSSGIQSQEKMCLYTVAFQCERPPSRMRLTERWVITPITVQALHLLDAKKVLVHYSLVEPDRCEQGNTLPEPQMLKVEPHLASMVERALRNAGVNVDECDFEAQCTGTNLVRDRHTWQGN